VFCFPFRSEEGDSLVLRKVSDCSGLLRRSVSAILVMAFTVQLVDSECNAVSVAFIIRHYEMRPYFVFI
jgi:hypothetical protein